MSFDEIPTALLAEGGWSELIGVIVLVGIYAAGAIAKMVSKRSDESKEDAQSKQRAVQLAKKYAQERQSQRAAPRHPDTMTEWDRMQELKRRRQGRQPEKQPSEPVSAPAFREREMPFQQPKMVSPTPELMQSAESPKPAIFHQFMEAIQQRQQAAQSPQSIPKPKTVKPVAKLAKVTKKRPAAETAPMIRPLDQYLRNAGDLRAAIVLKEILDKPLAMREDW
jgi:hypothetical protein